MVDLSIAMLVYQRVMIINYPPVSQHVENHIQEMYVMFIHFFYKSDQMCPGNHVHVHDGYYPLVICYIAMERSTHLSVR